MDDGLNIYPFYDTFAVNGGLIFHPPGMFRQLPAKVGVDRNTTHFCFFQICALVSVAKHSLSVKYPLCQMTAERPMSEESVEEIRG
jgi:hypothetical protein